MKLMKIRMPGLAKRTWERESGRIGYALLWVLGVPLPLLALVYFIRGH